MSRPGKLIESPVMSPRNTRPKQERENNHGDRDGHLSNQRSMNIRHSSSRGSVSPTAVDVVLSTSRHKTLFFILTIAIVYATLGLFEQSSDGGHYTRQLSGQSTAVVSNENLQLYRSKYEGKHHIKPFTIYDALKTKSIYKSQFGLAVYSPESHDFTLYYPTRSKWKTGCHKLIRAFEALSTTLRDMNVTEIGKEFVVPISAGDSPRIHMTECVINDQYPCFEHYSPVLQFGSGFVNPVIPGEIIMPMPQNDHLNCFQEYSHSGRVCPQYARRRYYEGQWENLTPQVVWRGTDFTYLGHYRKLRAPNFEEDMVSIDASSSAKAREGAVKSMKVFYDELVPRWKGVALTAEAEQQAERQSTLPWANIKFSHFMSGGKKTVTSQGASYLAFESSGIPAIGEYLSLDALSQYKYHIDLGGGGGTTWSGTSEKLALPGLLFHHVTPMKDYFHNALKPWEHYVPIKEDLSDLKDKFEWAEANQEEAKSIAERSTEWVKHWFGNEGFKDTFDSLYREPLEAVLSAYQHVDDWNEVLNGKDLKPIMRCSGIFGEECEQLDRSLHYYSHRA